MTGCLLIILIYILALAVSWAITCGFVYLIMTCFSLVFSWPVATGVWLIIFFLTILLHTSSKDSKKR